MECGRYGLEGLIKFKEDQEYDGERYEIQIKGSSPPTKSPAPSVRIGIFDKVLVGITTEQDRSTQRGRVKMVLLKPIDSSLL